MTYQPRPGDIGLTQISGAGGKAIRLAQWLNGDGFKDFEHAFVVTSVGSDGTVWIVEAMPGGAEHVANWHSAPKVHYLRCPDQYRTGVARAALDCANRKVPYSIADYFSLAAHRLHIPAPHLRSYIRSRGHMMCSQLADYCALKGGWHLFEDGRWEGDVTPADLENLYASQRYARMTLDGDTSR